VHDLGLSDKWYAFRERAFIDVARAWCEANGIETEVVSS
jgi:hypothetical protein